MFQGRYDRMSVHKFFVLGCIEKVHRKFRMYIDLEQKLKTSSAEMQCLLNKSDHDSS